MMLTVKHEPKDAVLAEHNFVGKITSQKMNVLCSFQK